MKKLIQLFLLIVCCAISGLPLYAQQGSIVHRADSVLKLMTLEEKIGQMNQYNDDWLATGPVTIDRDKASQVRNGQVGSLLNCLGTQRVRK